MIGEQRVAAGSETGDGHQDLTSRVGDGWSDRDAVADELLALGGGSGGVIRVSEPRAAGGLGGGCLREGDGNSVSCGRGEGLRDRGCARC